MPAEAKRSTRWAALQFLIIVCATVLIALNSDEPIIHLIAKLCPMLGLVAWGVTHAKKQVLYVRAELGNIYEPRSWLLPIAAAIAIFLLGALALGGIFKLTNDNAHDDGVAMGRNGGIASCRDISVDRMRACGSLSCQLYEMRFASACASVADPSLAFCRAHAPDAPQAVSDALAVCAESRFSSGTCARVLGAYSNKCTSP